MNDARTALLLLLLLGLLIVIAFSSGTEVAMLSVNRYRLRHRAKSGQRAARLDRRRDVENHELVDPLRVVTSRELGGIPSRTESFEIHALDDLTVADIETGDDSLGKH